MNAQPPSSFAVVASAALPPRPVCLLEEGLEEEVELTEQPFPFTRPCAAAPGSRPTVRGVLLEGILFRRRHLLRMRLLWRSLASPPITRFRGQGVGARASPPTACRNSNVRPIETQRRDLLESLEPPMLSEWSFPCRQGK